MSLNIFFVIVLLGGWISGRVFEKVKLPSVLGMIIYGSVIGYFYSNSIPGYFWEISPFLKSFALVVILLRAGLGLNRDALNKAGITAVLMSFLPCIFEGSVLVLCFRYFFGFSWTVSGFTSFMLAAVSPAVVIPSMLDLKSKGFGSNKEVTTIILAGASADDVFAITLFSIFLGLSLSSEIHIGSLLFQIPVSIVGGIVLGLILGYFISKYFIKKYTAVRATEKTLILLSFSVLLVQIGDWINVAALLAVMSVGFMILENNQTVALELSNKMSKIWIFAQIILFVLIGLAVDYKIAYNAGLKTIGVLCIGLIFRSAGVWISTVFSDLNYKERIFCMIAYLPKATVQAALGSVALNNGIENGSLILAIAVLSIIFTAPLGLIGIRISSKYLLVNDFKN